MSEENAETSLLQTKIHMQDIYQRQQDTIISWNEPDTRASTSPLVPEPGRLHRAVGADLRAAGRSSDEPPRGDGGGGSGSPLGGGGAPSRATTR